MNAEELLVHDCSQWQGAERFHACIIDGLGILVLALQFECEVVGKMATLMIAAEKPQAVWIPYFQ